MATWGAFPNLDAQGHGTPLSHPMVVSLDVGLGPGLGGKIRNAEPWDDTST